MKLRVVNPTGTDLAKPSVAISEVEINEWVGSYTTNSTAALQSLSVNGLEVSAADLAAGSYDTEAILIDDIKYAGADNAAVTYILPYENAAKLIIESEDHSTRNTFTINLGADVSSGDAADDSRDYDYQKTTATAGSEYPGTGNEGPASYVVDNNTGTWWHTNWNETVPMSDFWITLKLEEETILDALRYYGRDGSENGRVNEYRVEVSIDGEEWTPVSTGTWENTAGWKLAVFDQPAAAKYVRLTGLHTFGDSGNDRFMSAAEIRLRKAEQTTDISSAEVRVPEVKEAAVADAEHPVTLTQDEITVTLDGKELRYGVDYLVSYENNTAEGTATAIVTGVGQYGYSGSASAEFEIKVAEEPAEPDLEAISVKEPCRTKYTEGETLDPAGLVLELKYSDGSTATAVYSGETAANFTFTPALDQQLTTGDTEVTVEYAGKAATFNINVQPAMVTITSVEVAAGPDKTEYTEGETLDPTGLVLRVIYSDGSDGTIGYNAGAADWFDFKPDLGTALTTDIKEVAVTYQHHTANFTVTVNGKDPGTDPDPEPGDPDPEPGDPGTKPEDPQNPGTGSSQNGDKGQSGNGDKAVQTGDTANPAVWAAVAALAGAAAIIAGRKRKSER